MGTLLLICLPLVACGSSTQIQSEWCSEELAIDGSLEDWRATAVYLEDAELDLRCHHDDEYLYVSVVTIGREIREQVLRQGFVLWLDGTGEERRSLGIKIPGLQEPSEPMSMGDGGGPPEDGMRPGGPMAPGAEGEDAAQRERMLERYRQGARTVTILRSEKDPGHCHPVAELPGIAVAVDATLSRVSYEFRIPLRSSEDRPYALNATGEAVIALGLQTPEMDRSARPGPGRAARGGRSGGMGGGMPGGMGGAPGGGGRPGGMGGGGLSMPEALDEWVSVRLTPRSQGSGAEGSR